MSRLRISNLSFCDTVSENSSIIGGGGFTSISPYGAVSVSYDDQHSAGYSVGLYGDSTGHKFGGDVSAYYGSAVASAVAHAAGTGTFNVSSSASAKLY